MVHEAERLVLMHFARFARFLVDHNVASCGRIRLIMLRCNIICVIG